MKNSKCVTAPYCGATATYSTKTGQCECNYGYKKQGKKCSAVSCTANSIYNPNSGSCECNSGYLVRDGKCASAVALCGFTGKYNPSTQKCVECDYDSYLKGGNCIQKPSCGLSGTFNTTTEICSCGKNYILQNGTCVNAQLTCGFLEKFNDMTKQCECFSDYVRVDGKCTSSYQAASDKCKNKGSNISYDYSSKACLCSYGYKADASHQYCVQKDGNEFPSNSEREIY